MREKIKLFNHTIVITNDEEYKPLYWLEGNKYILIQLEARLKQLKFAIKDKEKEHIKHFENEYNLCYEVIKEFKRINNIKN